MTEKIPGLPLLALLSLCPVSCLSDLRESRRRASRERSRAQRVIRATLVHPQRRPLPGGMPLCNSSPAKSWRGFFSNVPHLLAEAQYEPSVLIARVMSPHSSRMRWQLNGHFGLQYCIA